MTTRLHVALGSLAGVAVGALGVLWLRPAPKGPASELPAGHYWKVGDEVYVDKRFVDWLRTRIEPIERQWIVFPFKGFGLFVQIAADDRRLPQQEGHLYEVRQDLDRDNDREAASFLDSLLRLGALAHGGAFQSWSDVSVYWQAAIRRGAEEERAR